MQCKKLETGKTFPWQASRLQLTKACGGIEHRHICPNNRHIIIDEPSRIDTISQAAAMDPFSAEGGITKFLICSYSQSD